MKNFHRIMGLTLSGVLLAGTLAGCSKPAAPTATGEAPVVKTEDMIQKLAGIPAATPMFTVDGDAVTAEQLYYWLAYTIDDFGNQYFGGADKIDWTMEQGGEKITDYILKSAKQSAQLHRLLETKSTAAGIKVTPEDEADQNAQVAAIIEQLGGAEAYGQWLQQIVISDAGFRHMFSVMNYSYTHLKDSLYGPEGAEKPADEELIAAAEEAGKMLSKHILIKTVAEDGTTELPPEEQAAAKAKAEDLLAQLKAAKPEEQAALFDKLMNENSEDGRMEDGALAAPDGYLFGEGEMVPEFEAATKALEYNQISDLVKTTFGYHIILRLSPVNDEMRAAWANQKMNAEMDAWMQAAKVEDAPEMEQVDVQGFYEKLAAYRLSLAPAPTETPAPTATPEAK